MESAPYTDGETYIIHHDVKEAQLPPHPGSGWTRFVCISDTHSRMFRVPPGDVLVHAGDLTSWGYPRELKPTIEWLKSLDHPIKIIIAGNHDLCLDQKLADYASGLDSNVIAETRAYVQSQRAFGLHYLEHETLHFRAPSGRVWKVYGSPASPVYAQGAFQYESLADAEEVYNRIPNDTEILITHTPPYGTLDLAKRGKNAGCETLVSRLSGLKHCRLHVFGHIHEAAGAVVDNTGDAESSRVSVNAAVERTRSVIVVDLRN